MSEAVAGQLQRAVPCQEFSRLRGSTRISMCGSATAKMCAPGICCATRAKCTSGRGRSGFTGSATSRSCERAYEAVLAAEGSDWNWWYGPEHGSANDAEFDELYRKHLTEIYRHSANPRPTCWRIRSKGAGTGPPRAAGILSRRDRGRPRDQLFRMARRGIVRHRPRGGTMHGRTRVLGGLYYGFGQQYFYLRVDPVPEAMAEIPDFQFG